MPPPPAPRRRPARTPSAASSGPPCDKSRRQSTRPRGGDIAVLLRRVHFRQVFLDELAQSSQGKDASRQRTLANPNSLPDFQPPHLLGPVGRGRADRGR